MLLPGVSGHEGRGKDPASDLLSQPLEGEGVEVEVAEMRQGLELRGEGGVVEEVGEMGGVVEESGEMYLPSGLPGRHLEGEVAAVIRILKDREDEDWVDFYLLHVIDDVPALDTAALGPQTACVGVWYSGILISSQA